MYLNHTINCPSDYEAFSAEYDEYMEAQRECNELLWEEELLLEEMERQMDEDLRIIGDYVYTDAEIAQMAEYYGELF